MTRSIWNLLRYLPLSVQGAIKRYTSEGFRIWLREHAGASPHTIPDEVREVADGRRFHIGPDWIYWAIHMGLDFEPEPTAMVRKLVRPGDRVLDVGANFGWYTTLFAQEVGDRGQVFAFEPVPSTMERLRENLALNWLERRVTTVPAAVGKEPGEVTVYLFDRLSHSCASLSTLGETEYQSVAAPIVPLDRFATEHAMERVDFLKCDVEGSELAVLQGATKILSGPEAPIILIELNDDTSRSFGYSKQDLWQKLRDLGYDQFYHIASPTRLVPVTKAAQLQSMDAMLCGKGDRIAKRLSQADRRRQAA
jgi:FkbM family methyltransferase